MATLGVLGSLMSQLGSTQMPQYDPQQVALMQQRLQGGRMGNETALIQLEELKRQQAAEAQVMQAIQQNPALAQQFFGAGPVLGSLQTAPGGPGAAPMTQQTTIPGQPPGAPQVVPGGQDLSQFATQGTPQSTLASLGPPPQGPPQAPQHPLLEMARRDPRAALLLQQRMQQQQDRQSKMEEQRLDIGVKVSEAVARQLQGVTDQASLDDARERIRLIHPQAAAQIPQSYSKEAVEAVQQRGIAVADVAKWRKDMATARQTEVTTEHLPKVFGALEQFATGMGGAQEPPSGTTTPGTAPPATARPRTAPAAFETAIADATRLYPQVKPERITAIIAAESNFDAKAVSPKGAQGPMQLMPGTAKDMGVDDPFDITQNVRGGTRYYAQLLTKYGGDERKALAAYNWGPGNLDKVGGDVSKAPPETQAYVQKVLGGGGSTGATGQGGTGTAQAPKADPRITQLQARIDQGNKAALQAEAVGMEGPARQIRAQVAQLDAQRQRLEDQAITERHRAEETPRAVEREREIIKLKQDLERQRQSGPMLPEAKRELVTKLRADVRQEPTHKTYQDVRNGYQNVRIGAELDSAQGDLAIINGLAKILDPTSAVMTGEAKNVEEAQGQLQRWFNSPQRFFEGDRISVENRPRFLKMAYALAKEKLTTAQTELKAVYGPLAKDAGIDFEQIVPLTDLTPLGPGPNVSKFEKLVTP